jgi:hypothetical protein
MGGTNETLFGDLRVARRFRVRSATASAAGRDQPAASSAGSPTAAEVTLGGSHWSERMEIAACRHPAVLDKDQGWRTRRHHHLETNVTVSMQLPSSSFNERG